MRRVQTPIRGGVNCRSTIYLQYHGAMTDDARSITDQLDELGTQLDWVREYL
jgi:hypothetical protein